MATDGYSWASFGERLRWAVDQQPAEGRRRGLRLFQDRMETHFGGESFGTSLSTIQNYVRGNTEPTRDFVEAASRLLAVRPEWLAFGSGAPTVAEEADRDTTRTDRDLHLVSNLVYEALNVPTRIPPGTPTITHPEGVPTETDRFWGPAAWAPLLRRTALRLYQQRPMWSLLVQQPMPEEEPDVRFEEAARDVAAAVASPLAAVGIDAEALDLETVGDFVSAVALALQRAMHRYVPGRREPDRLPASLEALLERRNVEP